MVADHAAREAGQDRRPDRPPWPLRGFQLAEVRSTTSAVRRDLAPDRLAEATLTTAPGMSTASNDRWQPGGRGASMSDREQPEAAQKAGASLMRRVDAADGAGSSPRRLAESGGTADCRHSEAGYPGVPSNPKMEAIGAMSGYRLP